MVRSVSRHRLERARFHPSGPFSPAARLGQSMLPETARGRLEWAIRESTVVLGILLFWIGVVLAVSIGLWILTLPYQFTGGRVFRPLVELTRAGDSLWVGVVPLTSISAVLYTLARVGELLIDHHAETVERVSR